MINVICEACHGGGAKHIKLAKGGKFGDIDNGFIADIPPPLGGHFKPGEAITPYGKEGYGECRAH